jgi:hypothetical protein
MYCAECGGTGAAENGHECPGCWGAGWVDAAPPPAVRQPSARKGPGYERDAHYMGVTDSRLAILDAIKDG